MRRKGNCKSLYFFCDKFLSVNTYFGKGRFGGESNPPTKHNQMAIFFFSYKEALRRKNREKKKNSHPVKVQVIMN